MSALSVTGVTKGFAGHRVLSGVDLEVPEHSLTAILGPSGCGKTTLLRIVAGFTEPDAGTVRIGDQQVAGFSGSLPARHRRVGYVPQEGALFPHLDVDANIGFGLPRSARRARSRVPELLDLVGLDPQLRSRYPHELSGGQQQRVALARALAPAPSLVLLDEPFASLDAGLREGTGRAVRQALRTAGATAVLVTHDQAEALSLADQVAVMGDGVLVQTGPPEVVYAAPLDPAVAQFVGAAVLLPATVRGQVASCVLGSVPVHPGSADGEARLLLRPEQLLMDAPGQPGVRARVVDVSYYGHDTAVRLELLPSGQRVLARTIGIRAPDPGTEVTLSVQGSAPVFAVAPES